MPPDGNQELALAAPENGALPAIETAEPTTLLGALVHMAKDPAFDVAKFEALLQMQERTEARQAEVEFNQALARLAAKMPRVKKNGRVTLGNDRSYLFSRWEDIDAVIRPLMTEEGFSLSFDSQAREGGGVTITGTLLHRMGASRSASMPLALDTGPGRNNLQAMGSTLSYGKRYCAEMLLNIVREGQDDDGLRGGIERITAEQIAELERGLKETNSAADAFLNYLGYEALADIQLRDLPKARNALQRKRDRMGELR